MIVVLLYLTAATDHDTSTTRLEGLTDTSVAVDQPPRGEVGGLDIVHQPCSIDLTMVIDIGHTGIDRLTQVVWSHIRSHTDSDPCSSID